MTRIGAVPNFFNPEQASQCNQPSAQCSSRGTVGDPARRSVQPQQTETQQQPEEKSFGGKILDRVKGYLNTMMGNNPVGLLLGAFGIRPPWQSEGERFRKDIAEPIADAVASSATAMGLPWVAAGAHLTKAGMEAQDGQYGDAAKDVFATIPGGTTAKGITHFLVNSLTKLLGAVIK